MLDEPSSRLDHRTPRSESARASGGCYDGRTAIVIAHRVETLREMDQIAVLEKGRVIQRVSHAGGRPHDAVPVATLTSREGFRHTTTTACPSPAVGPPLVSHHRRWFVAGSLAWLAFHLWPLLPGLLGKWFFDALD